jgi:glutamine amidotransferase-like uncharacterized protein
VIHPILIEKYKMTKRNSNQKKRKGAQRFIILILFYSISIFSKNGFYKDLFMDGSIGLNSYKSLPAADHLNFSYEFLATEDPTLTRSIICGNSIDSNGILLYPDNQPRFRVLYTNGGNSVLHGDTLTQTGRSRINTFFNNGGSYTGSCAGAHLATLGTNTWLDPTPNPSYYHLWPGHSHYTQLAQSYTSLYIPADSPLYTLQPFTSDTIDSVYHNGGSFVIPNDSYYWASSTKSLATYISPISGDDTNFIDFLGHCAIWEYKPNETSGRLVVTGSHPEHIQSGDQLYLMASILQYASQGIGTPQLKIELQNGVVYNMNNNAIESREMIGDNQIHHFCITIPNSNSDLTITHTHNTNYQFNLFCNKDTFAFIENVQYLDTSSKQTKMLTIPSISQGKWFIAVECASTVITEEKEWGAEYVGNIDLLNGVPYTISVSISENNINQLTNKNNNLGFKLLKNGNNVFLHLPLSKDNQSNFNKITLYSLNGSKIWSYNYLKHSSNFIQILPNLSNNLYILKYKTPKDNYNFIVNMLTLKCIKF